MDFKTNSGANPLLRVHKSDGTIEAFSGHFSGSITSTGSFGRVEATTIAGHSPITVDSKISFNDSIYFS